jgi:long-chain acyl-CoA synthetase
LPTTPRCRPIATTPQGSIDEPAFVLDHRVDVDPDGDAVSDGSQPLTNDELLHRVRAASRHIRDLGVRPCDVVALKLTNRIEFVVLLFAAWRLGAAVTPINPSLTDGEVDRQLDDSGARLLVTEDSPTAAHQRHHPRRRHAQPVPRLGGSGGPAGPVRAGALLIYTSGTIGGPKGVMLDPANVDAMAAMGLDALGLAPLTGAC